MITEISIENFLSIKEKIKISLDSSGSKKLLHNLINVDKKEKLLKSIVIYGANASGKSNLIKSVLFMWNMVKNSHAFNVDSKIPRIPFKLDESSLDKPSKFELIFIHKNIKYKYGFSCNNEKFIDEYLFYWPQGRKALIFQRKNANKYIFNIDKPQQKLLESQMNDNVLYLSRATQLGYEKTKEAYEFIVSIIINIPTFFGMDFTVKKMYEDEKLRNKIIEILQKTDFGGIKDIKVVKEKRKSLGGFEFKIEKDKLSSNPLDSREEDFYDFKFIHKNNKGKIVEFSSNEESHGTQRALSMLGPFFDILENGKVAFIDEFEVNLHPNITRFLIRLFNSKLNNKNAQLIFTTHDTNLLKDNELLRRDQVYICSKEPNKNTHIASLLDYDLRETTDFERAYLNGRVGGLPLIDETLFE